MKKLFKKATMLLCAIAVTIGFVGVSSEEAFAASKYGGVSTVTVHEVYAFNAGKLVVESSSGGSTSGKLTGGAVKHSFKISGYSNKKSDSVTLKAKFYDNKGKLVDTDSIKVKVTDLGSKKFEIKFGKSFNNIKSVSIKKK